MLNPAIPRELLDFLEQAYPARPPEMTDTDRMVWFKAGQRAVVENLKGLRAAQEREAPLAQALKEPAHVHAEEAQGGGPGSPAAATPGTAGPAGNRLRW